MDVLCLVSAWSTAGTEDAFSRWKLFSDSVGLCALKQAKASPIVSDTVLLSSDKEAIHIAASLGMSSLSPMDLKEESDTSFENCILRTLDIMQERNNKAYDWVLLLNPYWPLRLGSDLENALAQAIKERADVLASCSYLPAKKVWQQDLEAYAAPKLVLEGEALWWQNESSQRQSTHLLVENTAITLFRAQSLKEPKSPLITSLYPLQKWQNVSYDDPDQQGQIECIARRFNLLEKRALQDKGIELLVFDFDGVLTNNKVIVFEDGREAVVCDRGDGLGFELLRKLGIPIIVLSSEVNPVVKKRCEKLSLTCFHGVKNKISFLHEFAESKMISLQKTAYVGNDLNDLECLLAVGFPFAPSDAVQYIKDLDRVHVLRSKGGQQLVRELVSLF